MKEKGLLLILSGPSGAGKGTVYNEVLRRRPEIKRSVSVTTRAPRKGEVEGVHYYFRTVDEYRKMLADGAFLETASVYSNYYGTPKAPVYEMLERGEDVMFEIDTLGAEQIKRIYPESIAIFIMPPSMAVLEKRLRDRGTDSDESIRRRLGSARSELNKYANYDYIVFNDELERAINTVIGIIDAEKCRSERNASTVMRILAE